MALKVVLLRASEMIHAVGNGGSAQFNIGDELPFEVRHADTMHPCLDLP